MKQQKNYYIITDAARTRFKIWQVKNRITTTEFAKRCNCSRVYIYSVINGKRHITKRVREMFEQGGYKLI